MYNPTHFQEHRVPVLHQFITEHPLAALVTAGPDGLTADHVPMEIDPAGGALGTLRGHVSRANPLWQRASGTTVLAIFQGPQGYVTPAWYPAKAEHGRVVPTWNYAVVHAHGELRAVDDARWLRAFVERLTDAHEAGRPKRWHVADAPEEFVERQLGGIVGIEIALSRLEGKWKMSQNRSAQDRAGVVHGLRRDGDPPSLALAEIVARRAEDGDGTGRP